MKPRPAAARKLPAKAIGLSQSLVRMMACGPRMPEKMPPAMTSDIALVRTAMLPASIAAKRYCWLNAPDMPIRKSATTNSANVPCISAYVASRPPSTAGAAPSTKPLRRPIRLISMAAGIVVNAEPTVEAVTGSVARDLSGPRR